MLTEFSKKLINAVHKVVDEQGCRTRDIAIAMSRELPIKKEDFVQTEKLIS
jgi:hypothetical protein